MRAAERAAFGNRVRRLRADRHWTQDRLAALVRTTPQTVRAWEAGRTSISPPLMERLAAVLQTTPSELWPSWRPDEARLGGQHEVPRPGRAAA